MTNVIYMLISAIFLLLAAFGYFQVYLQLEDNEVNICCIGLGAGLSSGFQAIAHYYLAMRYRLIATEVPAAFEGLDPPETSDCKNCLFMTLKYLCWAGGFL
jgi:hypothetical protein